MAVVFCIDHSLSPAYNEHPATTRVLCIKIIDCNVKKFDYNEHLHLTSSFFCNYLFVVSETQCIFIEIYIPCFLNSSTVCFYPQWHLLFIVAQQNLECFEVKDSPKTNTSAVKEINNRIIITSFLFIRYKFVR